MLFNDKSVNGIGQAFCFNCKSIQPRMVVYLFIGCIHNNYNEASIRVPETSGLQLGPAGGHADPFSTTLDEF